MLSSPKIYLLFQVRFFFCSLSLSVCELCALFSAVSRERVCVCLERESLRLWVSLRTSKLYSIRLNFLLLHSLFFLFSLSLSKKMKSNALLLLPPLLSFYAYVYVMSMFMPMLCTHPLTIIRYICDYIVNLKIYYII